MLKKILFQLSILNRPLKQLIMILVDSFLVILVLLASFSIRLGLWFWPYHDQLSVMIFGAPILAIPIFASFRLYQAVVRFIGVNSFISILQAVSLFAVIWGLISLIGDLDRIPKSVILINWMLILIVIGSSRLIIRWIFSNNDLSNKNKKNVIIYGAGIAGRELSHALQLSEEYSHVAYIDDNLANGKMYLNNIRVFPYDKIHSIIKNKNVSEVLLAMPSISRKQKRKIIEKLNLLSVHVRSLPSVSELAGGKVKIDDLLEIDLRHLLGRESVKPIKKLLKVNIANRVVLVTGAGGSIGSELSRQIVLLRPKKIILYDLNESSLYQIEQELIQYVDSSIVTSILGSVRDKNKLKNIFEFFHVQTIYHAAAYKHVPLVEFNQSEGVLNNIFGTLAIAEASIQCRIQTFVLISSDKAVRPTNVMGVTKRISELILQALSKKQDTTCFSMVRFGNVLDSSGSVIPTFKKQIKNGGPVTVTDKSIVRYFMTIPEAVELVIQAGAMSNGGDVFVLDMGEPLRIYDLAVNMIQLSGLTLKNQDNPDGDIEIEYTGLRPGEKLYEELLVGKNVMPTDHKLILSAKEVMINWDELNSVLKQLEVAALKSNHIEIRDLLKKLVPEFTPQERINDLLYQQENRLFDS